MRFRLRTLLVVFLLLCVSAPWWPGIATNIWNWWNPPKAKVYQEDYGYSLYEVNSPRDRPPPEDDN